MGLNFNRRQCVKALKKLEFQKLESRRGKHDKFIPPASLKHSNPPFIMIPRHNNIHCQNEIVKELAAMGGEELVKKFQQYL
ncbi:hypothetical protein A2Y83_03130 [Candidatus Falkowbacteria bacterium RBG_13_39_14]|uniref:Addiction module toxin, HicA family n=1 Tax=Candidatus Falkowbacteria bacterium RBG_13_39_14 TaxID=1797985 RepID=A0A1F5S8W2_9BACT|nr:MAG: hypothetical protein A2Y83_03130 [Candidatus Falkowbacteria bacterium RBG_13_39_14]